MTDDSEALAALAQQVGELRAAVERYQAVVAAWDSRLETEGIGGTMMLRLEVKQQRERLDEAVAKHKLRPPPAPWWCGLTKEETAVRMAELRGWVEGFLRSHYPGYTARLPRCWPAHMDAVWELSTLMAEWQRIYSDEDNRDLEGALTWHDKWMPGVLGRLAEAIKCDEAGCRVTRPRVP
ncbi:MAG: hypothetical protein ACRDOE_10905 [Streptosporangiaceae bacterium]